MAVQDFIDGLRNLGFEVRDLGSNRVAFPYIVPCGRFGDHAIELGFVVPSDFPLNPPGGPHVSPQLLPISGGGGAHPTGGVHASDFGPTWEYWSRPLSHWPSTARSVRDVMAHVRHLFDTQ
jgi:hypothetical protein